MRIAAFGLRSQECQFLTFIQKGCLTNGQSSTDQLDREVRAGAALRSKTGHDAAGEAQPASCELPQSSILWHEPLLDEGDVHVAGQSLWVIGDADRCVALMGQHPM